MNSSLGGMRVRASVRRYGPHAALHLMGSADATVDPLDLVVDGQSHPVRVLFPPDHLDGLGPDATYGFRSIVPVDPTATNVAAHLVARGLGGLVHDLGNLPVPQIMPLKLDPSASTVGLRPAQHDRLNLLVAPHADTTGGAQWWLSRVVDALVRTDWAKVTRLQPVRNPTVPLGLALAADDERFEAAVASRRAEIARLGPDIALINTVEGLAVAEACRRSGVPFHWAIHESYAPPVLWASVFGEMTPSPRAVAAFDECLATARTVIFVANETRAIFDPYVSRQRSRVFPFRAASQLQSSSHLARLDWAVPEDAFLVVSVGTLEERKNPGLLIAAMARARRDLPRLHLLLAGPGPSYYGKWLASLANQEGLEGAFTHIREVIDINDLLPLADLFVSASDVESRPVVLMEAMVAGVPIVAVRACGLPELIRHGVDGLLCPPGDRVALAAAVVKAGRSPHLRSQFTQRAYETVATFPANWANTIVDDIKEGAKA